MKKPSQEEMNFLRFVYVGQRPPHATSEQNNVRQRLRRRGWIYYAYINGHFEWSFTKVGREAYESFR